MSSSSCSQPVRGRAYAVAPLRTRLAQSLRSGLGVGRTDALCAVDHLIRAEQAGKRDHGLIRVRYLLSSGKFASTLPPVSPTSCRTEDARVEVDGRGRLGYAVMADLVDLGCRQAEKHGQAIGLGTGVYPSGCLGDWARRAAVEHGCASLFVASSPPRVSGPSGKTPVVGTNPICIGIPAQPAPFVSDCSTSAITHGEHLLARRSGEELPVGVACDENGTLTIIPEEVDPGAGRGAYRPEGNSHKFFATALAIELLTSLGGRSPGDPDPRGQGVFCLFLGPDLVGDRTEPLSSWLRSLTELGERIPGWDGVREGERQRREGVVEVTDDVDKSLREVLSSDALSLCERPATGP